MHASERCWGEWHQWIPPSTNLVFALVSDPVFRFATMMLDFYPHKSPGRWAFGALWSWGESNPRPSGEIRPRYDHPRCIADAATPTGRLDHRPKVVVRESSFRIVSRLSCGQRSFLPSSPASVAGLRWIGPVRHFCSRCLFTHLRIRRRERTARWQFCWLPRLASLSNSGRTLGQQN